MSLKKILILAVFSVLSVVVIDSCFNRKDNKAQPYVRPLEIVKLSDAEFLHISYLKDGNGGYIPCNGFVFIDNGEALIFDTPINDSLSNQLVDYISNELKASIKGVIVNHSHIDASGGLRAFESLNIPSYASQRTANRLANEALVITKPFDTLQQVKVGTTIVYNHFMGEGHTTDNIVSYIPKTNTLVGGCMVKSIGALQGNIKEANLDAWPQTIAKIKATFTDVEKVIPGHGGVGDRSLLDYTIAMFSSPTEN